MHFSQHGSVLKYYFKHECECFTGISKHDKSDEIPGLLLFSSVWKAPIKHEARVFEMASQSAPNCKQKKKRKQKNRRTQKSQACEFCLLLFNQRTVCDDNVRVFHNSSLFISSSHNLHSVAFC